MEKIFNIINIPLGWLLDFIAGLFNGNFAAAVFIFTLFINLLFIPITIKSQKSSVDQMRIRPKLEELKKKYGDDKQKYSAAMQELYQEEGVSMSGGCLPMIFRMLIMFSIYYLIMSPLTYLTNLDASVINSAKEALELVGNNVELKIIDAVQTGKYASPEILRAIETIDFNFFGIDLTETPKFSLDIFNSFRLIWIMPLLAFASQMLSSFLSMVMQKRDNPMAPNMMGMMLMMPLISLVFGFTLPGGVTFYWACSSLVGGLIQVGVQYFYGPNKMLAKQRSNELTKQCDIEAAAKKKLSGKK